MLAASDINLAQKIERSLIDNASGYGGILGSQFFEDEEVAGFITDYKISWLNGVLRINSQSPQKKIGQILQKYRQGLLPATWHMGALTNDHERIENLLIAEGLEPSGNDVCMVLAAQDVQYSEPLPELRIDSVRDIAQISDVLVPFQIAIDIPQNAVGLFEHYIRRTLSDITDEVWFVGYVNHQPVCCASYFINNEVILIINVATLPEFRCRGYAKRIIEQAIAHALNRAAYPIALYAWPDGLSLYRNMGFKELYKLKKYRLRFPAQDTKV